MIKEELLLSNNIQQTYMTQLQCKTFFNPSKRFLIPRVIIQKQNKHLILQQGFKVTTSNNKSTLHTL